MFWLLTLAVTAIAIWGAAYAGQRVSRPIGASWKSRLLLGILVALAAFALDHATKLASTLLPTYVTNPSRAAEFYLWLPIVTFVLGSLIPSTAVVVCLGLMLGGASANILDFYVWPGGVPDFIRDFDGARFNVADVFIAAGLLGAFICATTFGVRRIRDRLRRNPD